MAFSGKPLGACTGSDVSLAENSVSYDFMENGRGGREQHTSGEVPHGKSPRFGCFPQHVTLNERTHLVTKLREVLREPVARLNIQVSLPTDTSP